MSETLEAKKRLYALLLDKGETATEVELEIMCELTFDHEIRDYLERAFKL
jgi:hypothetical protein